MSTNINRAVVVTALLMISLAAASPGVAAPQTETARTVTKKVAPLYPSMARQGKLKGTVKLLLVVMPDGKVKSVGVIGGHPMFVVTASEAAKQWRFAPAAKESRETLSFEFQSPQ